MRSTVHSYGMGLDRAQDQGIRASMAHQSLVDDSCASKDKLDETGNRQSTIITSSTEVTTIKIRGVVRAKVVIENSIKLPNLRHL